MMKLAMSPAAAALLRALLARAGVERDRILLSEIRSVEWNSLTFSGERHEIELRVTGHDNSTVVDRLTDGLDEADFCLPGHILADIALIRAPSRTADGAMTLKIEALTVAD